uniref:Uncharacterized protein n=1 Tax=Ciona savignyi TaxID=51511 RepID=H2Z0L0_CIOSA
LYLLLVSFIYLPLYLTGVLSIKRKILYHKIKQRLKFSSNSVLGLVSRKHQVEDVLEVSTNETIDFLKHRNPCYLHVIAFSTPNELVKLAFREQTIDLISDAQLAYVIFYSVYAHALEWDENIKMYRLDMQELEQFYLFNGFYWECRGILIRPTDLKIIIKMNDGNQYHSDITGSDRANYNLAKLHAQVICLSYLAPGLKHNHVHFVFPSSVCVHAKQKLDHQSTLFKLLSPHFRFTEQINHQALFVGKATSNKRTLFDRLFFFWQPLPVTNEQFVENVAEKCKTYYIDTG